MSSITTHNEDVDSDPTEAVVEEYYGCAATDLGRGRSSHALDGLEGSEACRSPAEVIAVNHQKLLHLVYLRQAVMQALSDTSIVGIEFGMPSCGSGIEGLGDEEGEENDEVGGDARIVVNRRFGDLPHLPLWNPPAPSAEKQCSAPILTWTSKMACPSFSLPSGAPSIGGSCPGAAAGQSVVLNATRKASELAMGKVVPGLEVDLGTSICNTCYAAHGRYPSAVKQFQQMLLYAWVQQTVADGTFTRKMIDIIDRASYRLGGWCVPVKKDKKIVGQKIIPAEPGGKRFFRIHDSGDWYSAPYMLAWFEICRALPDIQFWAPTRTWADGVGRMGQITEAVKAGKFPRNLTMRPSSYHVGQLAPNPNAPPFYRPGARHENPWSAGAVVLSSFDRKARNAATSNRGMIDSYERRVERIEGQKLVRSPARESVGPDDRYDWECRAYASSDGTHTCRGAVTHEKEGRETCCRVCWTQRDLVICYKTH